MTPPLQLLAARGLAVPDGRPLYAYRITTQEFQAHHSDLRSRLRLRDRFDSASAATFCLVAAEYLSRGDGSEWWSWEPIKDFLEFRGADGAIRDAVRGGLAYWKRPVVVGGTGRQFLGTLVCEGGLPLRLVQEEGTRLRRYFRELLQEHEVYPTLDLLELAPKLSAHLPTRMRNTVVYELAASLIEQVARMRRQNASMDDVAAWPIPLRLDVDVAREFFDGLRTAPRVRAATEVAVAIRTTLRKGPELLLQRDVVFPKTLSPSWLEQRLGLNEIPPRFEVSLQVEDGSRLRVGVAAMQGDHFFVRMLARPMTRSSSVVGQVQCIVSANGRDLGEFVPQGGTALPTTPWIFSDEEEASSGLLSASSFATQAPSVLVALPNEGDFDVDGSIEELGNLLGHARRVVRLRGCLYWIAEDNDNVLVTTGQLQTDSGVFELHGRRAPLLVREADLWLGAPSLWSFSSGENRRIDSGRLSWRSAAASTWRTFDNRCFGAGQLALRDENNGFRALVRILPEDFAVSLSCGQDGAGVVEVRSQSIVAAGVSPTPGLTVDVERSSGGFKLRVASSGSGAPPVLRLQLRFPDENELSITVPYPTERAVFFGRGGVELERGARRSVDELAQVRAVVVSPRSGQWSIDVHAGRGAELLARLRPVADGVHEVHLETYRDALSTILANSANLDEEVQLRIVREGVVGGREASMYVRRYDLGLRPLQIGDEHNVEIAREDIARMADETLASLHAEAISIETPDRAAVPLVRRSPGIWSTDNLELSPGPWLVLVRQGDYLRGRPFRITIPGGGAGLNATALGKAIAIGERDPRREEIERVVAGIVGDLASPEREVVRSQLSMVGRCPAGTLDVVRALTGTPQLAVQFLLESGSRQRSLLSVRTRSEGLWIRIIAGRGAS